MKSNGKRIFTTTAMWILAALAAGQPHAAQAPLSRAEMRAALTQLPAPVFPAGDLAAKSALAARSVKLDPALLQLSDEVSTKGPGDLASKAAAVGVPARQQRVMVTLYANDQASVAQLERSVRSLGGQVQADFRNAVFALVPVPAIERLGALDPLYFAAPQAMLRPAQLSAAAAGIRDGISASRIEHLQKAGITGKGVKIGVLDFGFQGLSKLVASGSLPKPKATRSFDDKPLENGEIHGTACVEVIHDMAPDAELYLASIGSAGTGDLKAAGDWLHAQGADIISFSGGTQLSPHDGTGIDDQIVDDLVAKGVVWISAAGNEADAHWSGTVRDTGKPYVEFEDGRNGFLVKALPNGQLSVVVTWDDWGSNPLVPTSSEDIDAYLFRFDGGTADFRTPVASSRREQRGRSYPAEAIRLSAKPDEVFVLVLRAVHLTRPVKLHVATDPGEMEPTNPSGSVGSPATARTGIAVGAVDVVRGSLEVFSGQGPTDDGRVKPDVSAPDRIVTFSYRGQNPEGRFSGTSAACPHVSGFAALLRQMYPRATTEELRRLIVQNVRAMGPGAPNNQFGYGHIDGSKLGPAPDTGAAPGGGELVDDVPGIFGSGITQRDLEQLWLTARRGGEREDLKIVTGRPSYKIGDGLKVGLRSDRACNYMLIDRDPNGHFTVLAPAAGRGKLDAGERYALPEGETWQVGEPAGQEGLLVVCSSRQVDLKSWLRNPVAGAVWFATTTFTVER